MDSKGRPTTLEEIEALPSDTLRPCDVAAYLHTDQYSVNCASKAGLLPWAYQLGSRTIIPKEAFIHFHKYGKMNINIIHTDSIMRPEATELSSLDRTTAHD